MLSRMSNGVEQSDWVTKTMVVCRLVSDASELLSI